MVTLFSALRPLRLAVAVAGIALTCWLAPALPAMPLEDARHLASRTGFGMTPAELARLTAMDFEAAVDMLLADVHTTATTPPPAWIHEAPNAHRPETKGLSQEEREVKQKEYRRLLGQRAQELKAWWWQEILVTESPLTERMTLFWHNHFTSSVQKVKQPHLIYQQNALLRRLALGNFRDLALATSQDPAMILYLDGQSNRKDKPNENYARELLELFTLGEGHYTEQDIKHAARAFTGYTVDPNTGEFVARFGLHDYGEKTFMGRRGPFDGNDIINIALEQPACATYITGKLWREFISPTPDPAEVERLAAVLRANNYELRPLMRELLLSPAFRDPQNRGTLVKSPVDLIAGTLRTFGARDMDTRALVGYSARMGQNLLEPPNVKGWPGGERWIDSNTLLLRRQFIERLSRGGGLDEGRGRRKPQLAAAEGDEMMMVASADGAAAGKPATPRAAARERRAKLDKFAPPGSAVRARMMELRKAGKTRQEIQQTIRAEIQAGKLQPSPAMAEARDQMAEEIKTKGPDAIADRMTRLPMGEPDWQGWIDGVQPLGAQKNDAALLLLPTAPTVSLENRAGIAALYAVLLDPVYQLK